MRQLGAPSAKYSSCGCALAGGASASPATAPTRATPAAPSAHPGTPLDTALLTARHWVSEIIYFPLETALLRHARSLGCRTAHGGGMAVGQAADAFRHFSGRAADVVRMRAQFERMGV
jgi:shikimate dehydrogenase